MCFTLKAPKPVRGWWRRPPPRLSRVSSSALRKSRGHTGVSPGGGGDEYDRWSRHGNHSLFAGARRRRPPRPRPRCGPRAALAAPRLGGAAAGAGRALRAADAGRRAAVLRGRRRRGHLLPARRLPCGEGRKGTKEDACGVCASLTGPFPRPPVSSAVSLGAAGGSKPTGPPTERPSVCWCF